MILRKKLSFICNPHNPTGTFLYDEEMEHLVNMIENTKSILIVDEACIDYVTNRKCSSTVRYVRIGKPVVLFRTFSKLYGMAGLRCGYVIGPDQLIEKMMIVRNALPFNVNQLALCAAIASMKDEKFANDVRKNNEKVKNWFYSQLKSMGLSYIESQANFVLVKLPVSSQLFSERLFKEYGILVRDASCFGFNNYVRISLATLEMMQYVVDAFKNVMANIINYH